MPCGAEGTKESEGPGAEGGFQAAGGAAAPQEIDPEDEDEQRCCDRHGKGFEPPGTFT